MVTKPFTRLWRRLTRSVAPSQPQELLIIATQRTGSNFVCECLRAFSGALVLMEVFHSKSVQGTGRVRYLLPELGVRLGLQPANPSDPALVQAFRADPARAWAALADIATKHRRELLAFKIFDRQLPIPQLAPILKARRPPILFLVRSRLDVYISYVKASSGGRWAQSDTTAAKPDISVEQFLSWSARIDQWYADAMEVVTCAGLRHLVLRYEDHIRREKDDVVLLLERALAELGVSVTPRIAIPPTQHFKQDRISTPFDKIGNGDRIRTQLLEMGRLDYSLDAPLSDRVWVQTASPE